MSKQYPKPKILLLDLTDKAIRPLKEAGFNALSGTFGRPFFVEQSDSLAPVLTAAELPNWEEQEIVIVDTASHSPLPRPNGRKRVSDGEPDIWASSCMGVIDPRPYMMTQTARGFDKILEHRGVFIVFVTPRRKYTYIRGSVRLGEFKTIKSFEADAWSFLSILKRISTDASQGEEVNAVDGDTPLHRFLSRHIEDVSYEALLEPDYFLTLPNTGFCFFPLLQSKYGAPVAGYIVNYRTGGTVILLPRFRDQGVVLSDLVQNVLPDIRPDLFPHIEGARWVHRQEYGHPKILAIKRQQDELRRAHEVEIAQLEAQANEVQTSHWFEHSLLTETGDQLVYAARLALEALGFCNVVDVDNDRRDVNHGNLQEDLRIMDHEEKLLVEVKGLSGLPREKDTLQVYKYVLRRSKEWDSRAVRGVALVNYQRNIPALERQHERAFTEQQIQDADQLEIALLSTWVLFHLIRGKEQWGWPEHVLQPKLYRNGLVSRVPEHYKKIGVVVHYYDQISVVSIELEMDLQLGDRLGFVLRNGYQEETVISIQVDRVSVQNAPSGARVGHQTQIARTNVPDGTVVYRVTT